MVRRLILFLPAVFLIFYFTSCEKVPPIDHDRGYGVIDQIPAEYGSLVAVTNEERYPGWAQLWFEDNAGVIRVVFYNWEISMIQDDVIPIPRSTESEQENL